MTTKTKLPNGVTVVSQYLAGAPATAVGLWLKNGSRHQGPEQSGFAHLLEHLLFKGTASLSASALAMAFERMGGQINAHTGRELMAIHGLVPNDHVSRLTARFGDMLFEPRFNDHDLQLERDVVLEEMAMVKDSPEEVLEEKAVQHCWPENPISWPILGDISHLRLADAAKLRQYLQTVLHGDRAWIVAVGGTPHEELVSCAASSFGKMPNEPSAAVRPPRYAQHNVTLNYSSNRACLLWTFPAPHPGDATYHTAVLANHLLGGGSSSRLFQNIREERGLVYDIQSQLELYSDCGLWSISTACEPRNYRQLTAAVELCVEQLAYGKLSDEEIAVSREFIKSNLIVERSNIETAMERIAREEIYLGRTIAAEEHLEQFDRVSEQDIQTILRDNWARRSLDVLMPAP